MSRIEWTETTWNPVTGCSAVSEGCRNCYAAAMTKRLAAMGQRPYQGLLNKAGHFNGRIHLVEKRLEEPLHWKKPRRVFVNSMSDLFHERVPDEFIRRAFAVMSFAGQHTFQILTKRPKRMAAWFADPENTLCACQAEFTVKHEYPVTPGGRSRIRNDRAINGTRRGLGDANYWPLPNVWLGTSVENQQAADERIPHLLRCPAAVRFLSCEPLLGALKLDLARKTQRHCAVDIAGALHNRSFEGFTDEQGRALPSEQARKQLEALRDCGDKLLPMGDCEGFSPQTGCPGHRQPGIDWVIVGGESGPGARDCCVDEIESIISQCRAAGVPCFVKQLGARPILGDLSHPHGWPTSHMPVNWETGRIQLRHPKGGDPAEWPEDLRVREYPKTNPAASAGRTKEN